MSGKNSEKEAVLTTIVGGRPPGCGTSVGKIPRGIEILVKKASVDPEFKEILLRNRTGAAAEIGLELNPSERAMINGIPEMQLRMIIEKTKIEPRQRPAFLGKAAALMIVALGATALTGCEEKFGGSRPDIPVDKTQDEPEKKQSETSVDKPEPKGPEKEVVTPEKPKSENPNDIMSMKVGGIRPDIPKEKPNAPQNATENKQKNETPIDMRTEGGSRPDKPVKKSEPKEE